MVVYDDKEGSQATYTLDRRRGYVEKVLPLCSHNGKVDREEIR
jgi:hypothetical protein